MNLIPDNTESRSTVIAQQNRTKRIESLDWLRGLMAISIMLYHFIFWSFFQLDASSLLGRLSIYAVSIFFIISGLSMAIVYNLFINSIKTAWFFLVRRIFRIWPLLWACVFLATLIAIYQNEVINWGKIVLNIRTLFGLFKPGAYINTGALSIGNEIVYYLLTPLIIVFFNKKRWMGNALTVLSCIIALIFAFFLLTPEKTLLDQWNLYINPLNNLFFYFLGIAIFYNLKNISIHKHIYSAILIISIIVLIFYPISGDRIFIVTGLHRILFSLIAVMLVISFYKLPFAIPTSIGALLGQFGIATYGVYLLHPIIFQSVKFLFHRQQSYSYIIFSLSFILTITIALLSYNLFEKPLMRLGKKITTKNSPKQYN
jgi:peptidoglycan/LPS O-acetylase OafA/YrhL